ncbi:hypothetical protein PHET_12368 [Paragonimus heterotremus]|uniref:Uncharacterized protein n=1 Tax=Paragonimus heterotremus TaxID=100268 RepID=A0A8J4T7D5_9TREM|nr:hypothetical protein PHET_12368 [Paragonimus heterotremus]
MCSEQFAVIPCLLVLPSSYIFAYPQLSATSDISSLTKMYQCKPSCELFQVLRPGCIPVSCESIRYIAPEILDLLNDSKTIDFLRLLGSTSSFAPGDPISCIVHNPQLPSLHLSDKDFENALHSAQIHHSSSSRQLSSLLHSRSPSTERRHVSAPNANRSTIYTHYDVETDANLAGMSAKSLNKTEFTKENEYLEFQQKPSSYQNARSTCGETEGKALLMEHCKRKRFSPKITFFLNEEWFNEATDVYAFG